MRPIHYLYDFVRYALGLVVMLIAALRRHISVTDVMITIAIAVFVGLVAWAIHWLATYVPDPDAPKTVCMCGKYGQAVVAINGRCDFCGWPQ